MRINFINLCITWSNPPRLGITCWVIISSILVSIPPRLIHHCSFCLLVVISFYLLVYVDDILLIGSDSVLLKLLITLPSLKFKLQDLSVAHYFLMIEVTPTCMSLILSQHKYALDIFYKVMSSCKLVDVLASSSKLDIISSDFFFWSHKI